MALIEMKSTIAILNTSQSGTGKSLTLVGYSNVLPKFLKPDNLSQIQNIPHNNCLTPDKYPFFNVCFEYEINAFRRL